MSQQSEAILELGKKLVDELRLGESVDTLGRWMAHYVAELIVEAEEATANDRLSKRGACANAILTLWKHRHELPNGSRPFEHAEPILRAVESFGVGADEYRYYSSMRAAARADEDTGARRWLDVADGIDHLARILVLHCLMRAAQTSLDRTKRWIALAESAQLADSADITAFRLLIVEGDLLDGNKSDDISVKTLTDRLSRLNAFRKLASQLASDLRRQLTRSISASDGS